MPFVHFIWWHIFLIMYLTLLLTDLWSEQDVTLQYVALYAAKRLLACFLLYLIVRVFLGNSRWWIVLFHYFIIFIQQIAGKGVQFWLFKGLCDLNIQFIGQTFLLYLYYVTCFHISNLSHVDLFEVCFSLSLHIYIYIIEMPILSCYLDFYAFFNFKFFGKYVTCITIFENNAILKSCFLHFKILLWGSISKNMKSESWDSLMIIIFPEKISLQLPFNTNRMIFHLRHIEMFLYHLHFTLDQSFYL